jgi:hypothetical protein
MSAQQVKPLLGQVVADATALLAETPDEIDASELPNLVSDAVALHSEDFVDLIGFNEAVNSIIYDTTFRGVVVKPANYEKSRARFLTLHNAYPYLEIDVNGYKVHILARRVAIKTRDATPPYNVRSYLVLEVSVTKPREEQTEEKEQEQGEEEEQGGAEEKS